MNTGVLQLKIRSPLLKSVKVSNLVFISSV